ncbi:MAG: DUF4438 domain-containing protein [Candidatus Cloacimonadota bacterium]|nr:MAG: DUF4438 domain-containing protein [Candidatus Cloacimonadota bacterium]
MMIRTNKNKVVMISVQGKVADPCKRFGSHNVDRNGLPFLLPGTGGITYNVKVGDPAFGWAGDHVEPGVSTILNEEKRYDPPTRGYNFYACVGNEAVIITGDAKRTKGVVTGHHGGIEHVLIDFPDKALKKMTIDDKILIKGYGQGFKLLDYPDIHVFNLDPNLFFKMGITESRKKGKIRVSVAHIVPGKLMGSGVGSTSMGTGDYDIMTTDEALIKEIGLNRLRFGDFVAIEDHDNVFGRSYRKGAVTIGIVIHSDCRLAGHGPGVTTLISSSKPLIEPVIKKSANIADMFRIGRKRPKKR